MKGSVCLGIIVCVVLLIGCSSSVLVHSWKNPNYNDRIDRIYIVGLAKNENLRQQFEEIFKDKLKGYGVLASESHVSEPFLENVQSSVFIDRARKEGAQFLALIRAVGSRSKNLKYPRITESHGYYLPTEKSKFSYTPRGPYLRFSNYVSNVDEQNLLDSLDKNTNHLLVLVLEAAIFKTGSGELVWSAQVETIFKGNREQQINDFVDTLIVDLKKNNLLHKI